MRISQIPGVRPDRRPPRVAAQRGQLLEAIDRPRCAERKSQHHGGNRAQGPEVAPAEPSRGADGRQPAGDDPRARKRQADAGQAQRHARQPQNSPHQRLLFQPLAPRPPGPRRRSKPATRPESQLQHGRVLPAVDERARCRRRAHSRRDAQRPLETPEGRNGPRRPPARLLGSRGRACESEDRQATCPNSGFAQQRGGIGCNCSRPGYARRSHSLGQLRRRRCGQQLQQRRGRQREQPRRGFAEGQQRRARQRKRSRLALAAPQHCDGSAGSGRAAGPSWNGSAH